MASDSRPPRATEHRLDQLRDEARRTGMVSGAGAPVAGGPMPVQPDPEARGYYGQPILKPPVWTWQIGLYLFVGGTAGMSAVIALAALATGQPRDLMRSALGVGLIGALISPCLLIWDLGRPARFLYMLRVFKWRSAMSVGVWTLVIFSGFVGSAFLLESAAVPLIARSVPPLVHHTIVGTLVIGAAGSGAVLATYTGVLLGATVIPAWSSHHRLLPFHFGLVALGSAAAVLELLGYRIAPLNAIGLAVTLLETGVGLTVELRRGSSSPNVLHTGPVGWLLRVSGVLTGPVAFLLRLAHLVPLAAACLLLGALVSRYGWILAGRASALATVE
jgi:hypothetical protein